MSYPFSVLLAFLGCAFALAGEVPAALAASIFLPMILVMEFSISE